jgi:hypothetical protein
VTLGDALGPMLGDELGESLGAALGPALGEALGEGVGEEVGGPSTTTRDKASAPSIRVILIAYLAGKSTLSTWKGIAKIEPPIPAGGLVITRLISGPGDISFPFAKEN